MLKARKLLTSLDTSNVVGLRDRAITAILIYTASRASAVAKLKRGSLYHAGDQWMLHFDEKGGKSREIPARHDLEKMLFEYIDAAGIRYARKETAPFRSAVRKEKRLTTKAMDVNDVCRMIRRRMKDAGLPSRLSPHSFRVTTITDLLEQGVPLEDVQHMAGYADPRTTRLYVRRQKKITTPTSWKGFRFESALSACPPRARRTTCRFKIENMPGFMWAGKFAKTLFDVF